MSTEISISDFKHTSVLPRGVQNHPNGYIISDDQALNKVFRWIYWFFALVALVLMSVQSYFGQVPSSILLALLAVVFFLFGVNSSFSTALLFHIDVEGDGQKYIEEQTDSTISCIPPKTKIVPFHQLTQVVQQYGTRRSLRLETSTGDRLYLASWTHWETQPEWGDWLNRMGLHLPLRYEETFGRY